MSQVCSPPRPVPYMATSHGGLADSHPWPAHWLRPRLAMLSASLHYTKASAVSKTWLSITSSKEPSQVYFAQPHAGTVLPVLGMLLLKAFVPGLAQSIVIPGGYRPVWELGAQSLRCSGLRFMGQPV